MNRILKEKITPASKFPRKHPTKEEYYRSAAIQASSQLMRATGKHGHAWYFSTGEDRFGLPADASILFRY